MQTANPNLNLSSLRVNLIASAYEKVKDTWGEITYDTDVNKIYLIMEGEGCIHCNNTTYYPSAGDLVFIPKKSLTGYSSSPTNTYRKYWCHFDADVLSIPLGQYMSFPLVISVEDTSTFENIFTQLIKFHHSDNMLDLLKAKSLLFELIYMYLLNCQSRLLPKDSASNSVMYRLEQYIDDNLHKKITLSELAQHVHLNPNYLCTLFASTFGLTPIEYINAKKLNRAQCLLRDNENTIEEIAYQLGFSSPYYFSSVFKKRMGVSPSQFRKTHP